MGLQSAGTQTPHFTIGVVDNDAFALAAMGNYLSRALADSADLDWLTTSAATAIHRCLTGPCPNMLLVDVSMSEMSGIEVIRTIRERDSRIMLLAVTSFPLDEYAQSAADAGAQAIAAKGDVRQLTATILGVQRRQPYRYASIDFPLVQDAFTQLAHHRQRDGIDSLTPRERTIVELSADGNTSVNIARQLGLSPATVGTYIQRACHKCGVKNRVQLIALLAKRRNTR